MNEYFSRFSQLAESAIGRLKVSGVLNGCLWLIGITFPVGLYALPKVTGPIQWAVFAIIAVPILLFGVSHVYFTFTDPDKLRSEDFELRKQALELIEEKGGRIPISDASIELIANPNYPALASRKEEDAYG